MEWSGQGRVHIPAANICYDVVGNRIARVVSESVDCRAGAEIQDLEQRRAVDGGVVQARGNDHPV